MLCTDLAFVSLRKWLFEMTARPNLEIEHASETGVPVAARAIILEVFAANPAAWHI